MHPFVSQFMGENRESLCRWKTFGDRDFAFSRDTFDSVSQYFFVQRDAIRTNQTFQRAKELARISVHCRQFWQVIPVCLPDIKDMDYLEPTNSAFVLVSSLS